MRSAAPLLALLVAALSQRAAAAAPHTPRGIAAAPLPPQPLSQRLVARLDEWASALLPALDDAQLADAAWDADETADGGGLFGGDTSLAWGGSTLEVVVSVASWSCCEA
jgi:hypothetical protein